MLSHATNQKIQELQSGFVEFSAGDSMIFIVSHICARLKNNNSCFFRNFATFEIFRLS